MSRVTEPKPIGVFALQGDFARHAEAWRRLGLPVRAVRRAADLEGLAALSLPGGESTTMLRLLRVTGLYEAFGAALSRLPVFATCAGAILVGKDGERLPAPPFGVLDAGIARNAYGTPGRLVRGRPRGAGAGRGRDLPRRVHPRAALPAPGAGGRDDRRATARRPWPCARERSSRSPSIPS